MSIVLASHGQSFATRSRARALLDEALGAAPQHSVTIDASGVFMSPSFVGALLVALVDERKCASVVLRGGSEHAAYITQDLAKKFGFADRVEVEQPTVPA